MEPKDSSLIVISNRLPFTLKRGRDGMLSRVPAAGGLVTAVAPVVAQTGGTWIGWPGPGVDQTDAIPESDPADKSPTANLLSCQIFPVNLTDWDFQMYYNGCCNATLWPLFHSMPDRAVFDRTFWSAYRVVNEKFARATLDVLRSFNEERKSLPIVWIHDYHLLLAATIIRQVAAEQGIHCKIAFFLHIPFPTWDVLKILPWQNEILHGILDCDLVGLHVEDYCINLLECCRRGLGSTLQGWRIHSGGRTVTVHPLPISIPFNRFQELAHADKGLVSPDTTQIILGVDRLDYTKGLVGRFQAFELLLSKYPEYVGRVVLLQVAVPSRTDVPEYQDLKSRLDQLVGRINGRFSTANWSPIRYIYGCVSQSTLAGLYRDADVALITPLRDGMNLVAKEFVACRIRRPGVLILSQLAGAGEVMKEALLVNPYEIDKVADVLHLALRMPEEEREVRMNCLRRRERINDVNHWMNSFMEAMHELIQENGTETVPSYSQPAHLADVHRGLEEYLDGSSTVALLLDFDGTLSPLVSNPEDATLPTNIKHQLELLAARDNVFLAIVSGRGVEDVRQKVKIDGITYAGNHGMDIIQPDNSQYTHPVPDHLVHKAADLYQQVQAECCTHGAVLENKGVQFTFHYRNVDHQHREPLIRRVKELIENAGFRVGLAHSAVESKPPVHWDKGRAVMYILQQRFGTDWPDRVRPIYIGDDVTDEDAMVALKGLGISFRITDSTLTQTAADFRLPTADYVLPVLQSIGDLIGSTQATNQHGIQQKPEREVVKKTTTSS